MLATTTLPTGVQAYGIRRLLNGRVVVASNGQVLYPLSGSIEQSPVPSQAGEWWRDVALIESGAFVCGSSGSVSSVDGPAWPNAQTGLFTAWSSPSGVAWFGGNHGSLHRFANADPVPVLPFGSYPIRALHIGSANHQFAVTYNRILARVGFRWDEVKVENDHDWTAVAEDGTGALWLIDSSGGIYRRASGSITDRLADPQVESHPLGPEFFRPRASAATQLANGEVLLGTGTVLTRGYADGSVSTEYDFATADAGVQQIVSIAEATDGSLFLVTLGTPVRVLSRQGGNWLTLQTSAQPIDDVSACPDGTVVAAGSHGYLRRFRVGSLPLDFDAGVPDTGVDFGSVWCDADNTAWALTNMGSVAHFTSQTSVDVQRTGWGRRNESGNLRPSSIRGNDTTLFIAGDSEAILARPIP